MNIDIEFIVGRLDEEIFFVQRTETSEDYRIRPFPLNSELEDKLIEKIMRCVMYQNAMGWVLPPFRVNPRRVLSVGYINIEDCKGVLIPGLEFTIEEHTIELNANKSRWLNEWHGSDENQTRNFRHPMSGLKWILKIMRKHREDKWIFIMYSASGGASSPVRIGEITGRETPVETVQIKAEGTLNWILWHQ